MPNRKEFSLKNELLKAYDEAQDKDGIVGARIAARLDAIAEIQLTEQNGSNRPGYSRAELEAKKLVAMWMEEAGLSVTWDGAGNVIGRLPGRDAKAQTIMSGSHVDSVPNGGHFDGVLGVISALEVVEAWNTNNYTPEKPYEVIVFADEEGSRFNSGFGGSEGMFGIYDLEEKLKLKDAAGEPFSDVLESVNLSVDDYRSSIRNTDGMEMFVELHIEQGDRLEAEDLPVGIVTGIAGPCWLQFTFIGETDHAGNTPMVGRQDALVAAGDFIEQISHLPKRVSETAVATAGKVEVTPNAVNIIPGEVTVFVDIRDIYEETRDELVKLIIDESKSIAKKHNLKVNYLENVRIKPMPVEKENQEILAKSFSKLNIEPYYLPSGAGHDAMIVGTKIPVAMIFVRSKAGISHHPLEWTSLADCVTGARVLKQTIEDLQTSE